MPRPTKVDVHPEGFYITWDDAHESMYPSRFLRFMCSCASCVSEWTGKRMVQEEQIAEGVHPVAVDAVGNYAIQITWSDGHSTGIYPFERLRQMCPCASCANLANPANPANPGGEA